MDLLAYGVVVRIASRDANVLETALAVSRTSLLNKTDTVTGREPDISFEFRREPDDSLMLIQDGVELGASDTELKAYRFFDSILRVSVGEMAPDRVFLHAGAVGWKGKSIIMPADSFKGKSTLVAELVRLGAEYYSDDFAVLDAEADLHPFPRKISMRTDDFKTYELSLEELGGTAGIEPIPPGVVLFTAYEPGAEFAPVIESAGNGLLRLVPFTLPIRKRPEFSMQVLHKLAGRAIMLSSLRGSAESFARTLLDFVDNRAN